MESGIVIRVMTMPDLKNSKKPILTPSFSADSITIRFAIAPIMVALPARVEAEAREIRGDGQSRGR